MIDQNKRFNIIMAALSIVFIIVIVYILMYIRNLESTNVFFKESEIKNITWSDDNSSFKTDGKTFNLTIDGVEIFNNEPFNLDVHTGEIVNSRLYLRTVNNNNIIIWFDEAEYKLDKK